MRWFDPVWPLNLIAVYNTCGSKFNSDSYIVERRSYFFPIRIKFPQFTNVSGFESSGFISIMLKQQNESDIKAPRIRIKNLKAFA
jgi:hypothetical protein